MIIVYCSRCGLRIPDAAADTNPNAALCAKCTARMPAPSSGMSSRKEIHVPERESARRRAAEAEARPGPDKRLVIGGAAACLLLIAASAFALRGKPATVAANSAESEKKQPVKIDKPDATPAPGPEKPIEAAPQPPPPPPVPVKKPIVDEMVQVREDMAKRRLEEAQAKYKQNPRAVVAYYDSLQVLVRSYRSTEAGAAAEKLLQEVKLPPNQLSLQMHLQFDERDGAQLTDMSPQGRDVKLPLDPTRVPGRFGNGLSFDGVKDFVALPDGLIHGSRVLSISLWFRTNGQGCLLGYSSGGVQQPCDGGYVPAIYVGNDNKLYSIVWAGKASGIVSKQAVTDGHWHHVVISANGGSQSVYLDGENLGSFDKEIDHLQMRKNHLGSGYGVNWPAWPADKPWFYYQGEMDDFRLFRVALTEEEIKALYKNANLKNERVEFTAQAENK